MGKMEKQNFNCKIHYLSQKSMQCALVMLTKYYTVWNEKKNKAACRWTKGKCLQVTRYSGTIIAEHPYLLHSSTL